MADYTDIKPGTLNKAQLKELYKISYRTLQLWLSTVPALGEYIGGAYTPAQVAKIFNHLGTP